MSFNKKIRKSGDGDSNRRTVVKRKRFSTSKQKKIDLSYGDDNDQSFDSYEENDGIIDDLENELSSRNKITLLDLFEEREASNSNNVIISKKLDQMENNVGDCSKEFKKNLNSNNLNRYKNKINDNVNIDSDDNENIDSDDNENIDSDDNENIDSDDNENIDSDDNENIDSDDNRNNNNGDNSHLYTNSKIESDASFKYNDSLDDSSSDDSIDIEKYNIKNDDIDLEKDLEYQKSNREMIKKLDEDLGLKNNLNYSNAAEKREFKRSLLVPSIREDEDIVFNNENNNGGSGVEEKVSLGDLLNFSKLTSNEDPMHKSLLKLDKKSEASLRKKGLLFRSDLSKEKRDLIERIENYKESKDKLNEWRESVRSIRNAEHLVFPLDFGNKKSKTSSSMPALAAKFEAKTDLEKAVETILKQSGISEEELKNEEEEKVNSMSKKEFNLYMQKLSKLRSLTFYQTRENKRKNKIKSKKWHRIHRKGAKRDELTLDELKELDREAYKEKLEKMEKIRIRERMRLKHKNITAWARHALKSKDPNVKISLEEHLELGRELRKKIKNDSDSDSDSDSEKDSEEHGGQFKNIKRKGLDSESQDPSLSNKDQDDNDDGQIIDICGNVVSEVKPDAEEEEEDMPAIYKLPFMKRARENAINQKELGEDEIVDDYETNYQKKLALKNRSHLHENASLDGQDNYLEDSDSYSGKNEESLLKPAVKGVNQTFERSFGIPSETGKRGSNVSENPGRLKFEVDDSKISQSILPMDLNDEDQDYEKLYASKNSGFRSKLDKNLKIQVENKDADLDSKIQYSTSTDISESLKSCNNKIKFKVLNVDIKDALRNWDSVKDEKETNNNNNNNNSQKNKESSNDIRNDNLDFQDKSPFIVKKVRFSVDTENGSSNCENSDFNEKKDNKDNDSDSKNPFMMKGYKVSEDKKKSTNSNSDNDNSDKKFTENIDSKTSQKIFIDSNILKDPSSTHSKAVFNMDLIPEDQKNLIKRAFASDHTTEEDFEAEKRAIVSRDNQVENKYASVLMPGWGEWCGIGSHESKRRKKIRAKMEKEKKERAEYLLSQRLDSQKAHVILDDKNVIFSKYQIATIPSEYEGNEKLYNSILRQPIGKEWNAYSSFRGFIQPKIQVKSGQIIKPLTSKVPQKVSKSY